MPTRAESQLSFFDPQFLAPNAVQVGSLAWLLTNHSESLFPDWLFGDWGGCRLGRPATDVRVLMSMILLRWSEEGLSRLASTRRAATDLVWLAASGLRLGDSPPCERTVRDFERFLMARHDSGAPRFLLFHEHVVRLCLAGGVVRHQAVWAMDSTPMWCYGAVLDTVRLLGDGTRSMTRWWARSAGISFDKAAAELGVSWVCAKSTKGGFAIEWKDPEARRTVVHQIAVDALGAAQIVRSRINEVPSSRRSRLLQQARSLVRIVANDLEKDEASGLLTIARRVARGRTVSFTDPSARHGRKSASKRFDGFKLSVLGDVESGLITAVTVHPGNTDDGSVALRLIRRAKSLVASLDCVLADTAYGGARLRHLTRGNEGVSLLAPPRPNTNRSSKIGRDQFEFDSENGTATCPHGIVSRDRTWMKSGNTHGLDVRSPAFRWSAADCDGCPLKPECCDANRRSRTVRFHPYEDELRAARNAWTKHETRRAYRKRSECERLVNRVVRRGGRRARAWGLRLANFQAAAIVGSANLALLAQALSP